MRQKSSKSLGSGNSIKIFWTILAFLGGYTLAHFFNYSQAYMWVNEKIARNTIPPTPKTVAKNSELPKPKFEFYTLLTKDDSTLPTVPAVPVARLSTIPSIPATKNLAREIAKPRISYGIQVAAFRKEDEAAQMKASLILRGFPAEVTTVKNQDIIWYRVIVGPFASQLDAEKTKFKLSQNLHVNGMVRKLET